MTAKWKPRRCRLNGMRGFITRPTRRSTRRRAHGSNRISRISPALTPPICRPATINAAASLDRHDRVGSLEPGKQFDAVLVNGPAINLLRIGAPAITAVFKRGALVSGRLGDEFHGTH